MTLPCCINSRVHRGFTLLEMMLVLLILSTMSALFLTAHIADMQDQRKQATIQRMAKLQKQLEWFRTQYCRLPCPTIPTLTIASRDYGYEQTVNGDAGPGPCDASGGVMAHAAPPAKSLGMTDKEMYDGYGRKFEYMVVQNFTAAGAFPAHPITAAGYTGLTVDDASGNQITNQALYVLASYGDSGQGGYLESGQRYAPGNTDVNALADCHCSTTGVDTSLSTPFVDATASETAATPNKSFGVILRYAQRENLKSSADLSGTPEVCTSSGGGTSGSSTGSSSGGSTTGSSTGSTTSGTSGSSGGSSTGTSTGSSTGSSGSSTGGASGSSGAGGGGGGGGSCEATSCCPGITIPDTLTGTITNKTGAMTALPNTVSLQYSGGIWQWDAEPFCTVNGNPDDGQIEFMCGGGTWGLGSGASILVGDATQTSASCSPFGVSFDVSVNGACGAGTYTLSIGTGGGGGSCGCNNYAAGQSCGVNSDCAAGTMCIGSVCTSCGSPYPSNCRCDADSECQGACEGQGTCEAACSAPLGCTPPGTCTDTSQCYGGDQCVSGSCVSCGTSPLIDGCACNGPAPMVHVPAVTAIIRWVIAAAFAVHLQLPAAPAAALLLLLPLPAAPRALHLPLPAAPRALHLPLPAALRALHLPPPAAVHRAAAKKAPMACRIIHAIPAAVLPVMRVTA